MRIKEIDGLRALAILAVLWHHYMSWAKHSGAEYGWLGVDLFFVISGFLITSILLDLRHKKVKYFTTFYARRAFRIFPPYYFVLAIYFIYSLAIHRTIPFYLWAKYIFYYSSLYLGQPNFSEYHVAAAIALGFGVLWSLSVEEVFYVLWAPIIRLISPRQLLLLLPFLIFMCPILRWHFHTFDHPEYFTFYCRLDALALGALVSLIFYDRKIISKRLEQWDRICDHSCLVFGIIVLSFFAWSSGSLALRKVTTVGIFFADLWFGFIIYYVIRHAGGSAIFLRALRSRLLGSIGKVSYSLYLVHYPLRLVAISLCSHLHLSRRLDAVVSSVVGLIISFGAAYAMWYLVEAPSLRLKDHMFPSKGPNFSAPARQDRNAVTNSI